MEPRLQRRVQRYGWDLAAGDYETLWQAQLAQAQTGLLAAALLAKGERVLDVACGTGLVSLQAARAVGPRGKVLGVDLPVKWSKPPFGAPLTAGCLMWISRAWTARR